RRDRDVAAHAVGGVVQRLAVVHLEADRAGRGRGRVGRVLVGDGTQGGLPLGERAGAGERQGARGGGEAAGDRVADRGRVAEHVLARLVVARDLDRAAREARVVDVGDRDRVRELARGGRGRVEA